MEVAARLVIAFLISAIIAAPIIALTKLKSEDAKVVTTMVTASIFPPIFSITANPTASELVFISAAYVYPLLSYLKVYFADMKTQPYCFDRGIHIE